MSPVTPEQHLQRISEGWDKNNARGFLNGKIKTEKGTNGNFLIDVDGKKLSLGVVKEKDLPYLQKVIETLLVEKSVCEARVYLAGQCRTEVAKKGAIPLYSGPDIEFNPSSWRSNTDIVKYETLGSIYKTNNVRPIAESIVNYINTFPENYIPLSVIEAQPSQIASYTKSKQK